MHHNIVFLSKNKKGEIRHASLRGTRSINGASFKGDVPGNDKNYGFNLVNNASDELIVFEAAIDLMSYFELNCYDTKPDQPKLNMLALNMAAGNPLERFLKEHSNIKKLILAYDNDEPGRRAAFKHKSYYEAKGYTVQIEVPD